VVDGTEFLDIATTDYDYPILDRYLFAGVDIVEELSPVNHSPAVLNLKAQCPRLEYIIYDDPRGLRTYTEPFLISLQRLEELGKKFALDNPTYFEDQVAKGRADDIAIICYTSGTTGSPKGVVLSHRNLILTARNAATREELRSDEEVLAYQPMAWVGDHFFSYSQSIVLGFTVNCPESAATVLHDLKEIAPTYFFAPPGIWERILTNVMVRVEDAAWLKRTMVHFFLRLAQDIERARIDAAVARLLALVDLERAVGGKIPGSRR